VKNLTEILSTNQQDSTIRLAILDKLKKQYEEDDQTLKAEMTQIRGDVDLSLLRRDEQDQKAIRKIQQQQSDLKAKQAEDRQNLEESEKLQKKAQKEEIITKKNFNIFDDVIRKCYLMLLTLQAQTGEKVFSDFSSTPTVYSSKLFKDYKATGQLNSMSLGTNEAWNFEFYANPECLVVRCQGGRSFVRFRPTFNESNDQIIGMNVLCYANDTTKIDTNVAYINYADSIDMALKTLIQNEDVLCPLNIHTNNNLQKSPN
jgi:hypothetical protein